MKNQILPFLAGAAAMFVLARIPQTRAYVTGGNKFFG